MCIIDYGFGRQMVRIKSKNKCVIFKNIRIRKLKMKGK